MQRKLVYTARAIQFSIYKIRAFSIRGFFIFQSFAKIGGTHCKWMPESIQSFFSNWSAKTYLRGRRTRWFLPDWTASKEVIFIDFFFAGKDSCKGDSGGPLMSQRAGNLDKPKYLYGIVSFGTTNCGSVRFVVPVYNWKTIIFLSGISGCIY